MRRYKTILAALGVVHLGCGSNHGSSSTDAGASDVSVADASVADVAVVDAPSDTPSFGQNDGPIGVDTGTLSTLTVSPATATIVASNGSGASQQLTAKGTYPDGSTIDLTSQVKWSRDQAAIGAISAGGNFTATGLLGGTEHIKATYGSLTGAATLLVKLQYVENVGVPASVVSALQAATAPDANVKFAYPYDGSVFPRGLNETTLQWSGGNVSDDYYVHLTAATFEYQSYGPAPSGWFDFALSAWVSFLDSTEGPAELTVARYDGTQATTLCDLHWTIATGSMRGTIYYSAYQLVSGLETADVLRIDPGAPAYTDFLGATSIACPSCHTVSASGNALVMNEGSWPNMSSMTYDLGSGASSFTGFPSTTGASQWGLAAVSPDGTTVVENFAPLYGNIGQQTGAFDANTGAALSNTNLEGKQLWMPAFAPDGHLLAYVDPTTNDLRAFDWDPVAKQASNDRLIVPSSLNAAYPQIQYPTLSPDHLWVVYQRGTALGSQGVPGDLYVASVGNPGSEVLLANLDGTSYPFAAGSRDLHLNYGPTFAPVAAGGYFWLVFNSRRTYGTKITTQGYVSKGQGVKQLWVAAFDQSPTSGADPSHPAFYLEGQSPVTLNARAFWALPPCKADGNACQSGTDCCGGYCDTPPDGGALECQPSPLGGCAQNGDKCQKAADCCNAPSGVTCINGVCSEAPPDGGTAN